MDQRNAGIPTASQKRQPAGPPAPWRRLACTLLCGVTGAACVRVLARLRLLARGPVLARIAGMTGAACAFGVLPLPTLAASWPSAGAEAVSPASSSPEVPLPPEALRYKGWQTSALVIAGLPAEMARSLEQGLVLSGESKWLRTQRPAFYPDLLEDDLVRARLFLARNGYPAARIRPEFTPNRSEDQITITLRIEPGPRVTVATVMLEGFPELVTPPPADRLALQAGRAFTDTHLADTRRRLERLVQEEGYARATVATRVTLVDSNRVTVVFACAPSERLRYSGVRVEGASPDLVELVKQTTEIHPGQWCTLSSRREAQTNLRLLDLFRQVRLGLTDDGPGQVLLEVQVLERPPRAMEFGLGYWSEEFLRSRIHWTHRNLLQRGRGLKVGGSYSRFQQIAETAVWWPSLLGARTSVVLSGAAERQDEEGYRLNETRGALSIRYRHSHLTAVSGGLTASSVNWKGKDGRPADGEPGGLLTYASLWLHRDSADDRLDPTSGSVIRLGGEWTLPGLLSQAHYLFVQTEWMGYMSLVDEVVCASRFELGWVRPLSGSINVLPNKRFYAGGYNSMRGFKRRELGPIGADGAPTGGESMVAASFEVRFPIAWRFRGAAFIDAGQVWSEYQSQNLNDLEFAAGPALIIRTPVGPARADLGLRLTDGQPDQPVRVFHFSVGHPF